MKNKAIVICILLILIIPILPVFSEQPVGFVQLLKIDIRRIQNFFDQYRDRLTPSWYATVYKQITRLNKSGKKYIAWKTAVKLVSIARLSGRKKNLADTLLFTARIELMHKDAAPMLIAASKIYIANDNNIEAGNCFQMLGNIALKKRQYNKANSMLLAAYSFFRNNNNRKAAQCTLTLGRISLIRKKIIPAESYFKLALQHAMLEKSAKLKSRAEEGLGDVAYKKNLLLKAQQHYEQAVQLQSDDISDKRMGQLQRKIGNAFFLASRFNSSINAYQKALISFRRADNTEMVLQTILVLTSSLRYASKIQEASQTFLYGLSVIHKSRNQNTKGRFHRSFALFNLWRGKYSLADKHLRKARRIFSKSNNQIGLANTYSDTAKLANYLGRERWRKAMLTRALRIYRKYRLENSIANILYNLADLSIRNRKYHRAEKQLKEALSIYKNTDRIIGQANVIYSLSFIAIRRNKLNLAIRLANRTERLNRESGTLNNLANAIYLKATIRYIQQKYRLAVRHINSALSLYTKADIPHNSLQPLSTLFYCYNFLKKDNRAERTIQKYLKLILKLRAGAGNEKRRRYLQETTSSSLKNMILTYARKKPNHALNILEQFRGRTFLEALQGREALTSAGISQIEIMKWLQLQHKLSAAQINLRKLNRKDRTNKREARKRILKARNGIEEFEKFLSKKYPKYAAFRHPTIPSPKTIQNILQKNESVIIYTMNKRKLGIWIMKKDSGNRFHPVQLPASFIKTIHRYRKNIIRKQSVKKSITLLRKYLLSPVQKYLPGKGRINIIPDGILGILPWTHILDSRRYLISLQPSLVVFSRLRKKETAYRTVPSLPILVFGGARYAPKPADSKKIQPISPSKRLTLLNETRNRDGNIAWANLPGSLIEGQNICRIWYPRQPQRQKAAFFFDLLASEAALKTLNRGMGAGKETLKLTDARILHFAVHGKADNKAAETSRLILTQKKALSADERKIFQRWFPGFTNEDGNLNAAEILALKIKADLVVLSACQTGMGKITGTEGIMGLTRSWFLAGAGGVLVSLWNVSDTGTRVFMTLFHKKLADGSTPAEALNSVCSDLKNGTWRVGEFSPDKTFTIRGHTLSYRYLDLSQPYFWAAFQYWGR